MRHILVISILAQSAFLPGCGGWGGETPGQLGRVEIAYTPCLVKCGIAQRAIAAGGAKTTIDVMSTVPITRAESGNPGIVRTGTVTSPSADHYQFALTSGAPGKATILFRGADGNEVDEGIFTVAPTMTIGFKSGFGSDPVNIVAGQKMVVHVTTFGAGGETLVGDGAIHFAYQGVLKQMSDPAPFADQEEFEATDQGDGAVMLSAIDATTQVNVHAVLAATIDHVSLADQQLHLSVGAFSTTSYTVQAGGMPIHGGSCRWTVADPSIAGVGDNESNLEDKFSARVTIHALKAGQTTATCTLNALTAQLEIEVM
jgi:hypothetical protein